MRLLRRVDALIISTVFAATLLAWLVFLAIDVMTVMTNVFADVGQGDYTWWVAVQYVALTLPRRAHELFPFGMLLGALLGLGALAASSELTALRAAGVSRLRIGLSTVMAAALMMVPVIWMGEVAGPWGEQRAQALAASAKTADLDVGDWSGIWAREGQRYFNARRGVMRGEAGLTEVQLVDVRIYEFRDSGHLNALYLAEGGVHGSGGWQLESVVRTLFAEDGISVEHHDEMHWESRLDPGQLRLGLVRPRYLAMQQITEGLAFMRENQLDAQAWEAAYWGRIFYPVSTLSLVLLAVPFAFGALRSGGMGKRLFLGIVLAISFHFLQRTIVDLAEVYRLNFALANALPAAVAVAAALWLFRRN